jgi:hypothetical protein
MEHAKVIEERRAIVHYEQNDVFNGAGVKERRRDSNQVFNDPLQPTDDYDCDYLSVVITNRNWIRIYGIYLRSLFTGIWAL